MTHKELKILAVLIVDEQERRFEARALRQATKEVECRTNQKEDEYASTKTKRPGSGGWKSPAQMASDLLNR